MRSRQKSISTGSIFAGVGPVVPRATGAGPDGDRGDLGRLAGPRRALTSLWERVRGHGLRPLQLGVLAAMLLLTGAAGAAAWQYGQGQERQERRDWGLRAASELEQQMNTATVTLLGVRGLLTASQEVTPAEFAQFAATFTPSLHRLSLTWAPRVRADARARFEQATGVRIITFDGAGEVRPAPPRPEYFPLLYAAAPSASIRAARGFDITAADPTTARALTGARDSGDPVLGAVLDAGDGKRLLPLHLAVYGNSATPRTLAGRREALSGYAGAVYGLEQIVDPLLALLPRGARVEILDGAQRIFGQPLGEAWSGTVGLGDRAWTIRVAVPSSASARLPLGLLGVGFVMAGLIALLFVQAARRERDDGQARLELARERDYSAQVLGTMQDGMLVLGNDGAILDVNGALCRLIGFERSDLIGATAPFPFWPQLRPEHVVAAMTAMREEDRQEWDVLLSDRSGDRRDCILTAACLRDGSGAIRGYLSTIKDVSARRRSEASQRELAAEHAALRRVATAVAAEAAPEEVFDLVAGEAAMLLGVEHGAVVRLAGSVGEVVGAWSTGRSVAGVIIPAAAQGAFGQVVRTGLAAHTPAYSGVLDDAAGSLAAEYGLECASAAPIRVAGRLWGAVFVATGRVDGLAAGSEDRLDEFAGFVAMAIAGAETRRELARQAATDGLTGLANQRAFHERLAAEVERARRHGRALSLVIFDIDHFKQVNDRHGHQVGDRVLAEVAARLRGHARPEDVLARVGGEEFALIVTEADAMSAYAAAERARQTIAAAPFHDVGRLTISAGVCDLGQAGSSAELVRYADVALYWAKAHGRDVTFCYGPELSRPPAASAGDDDRRLVSSLDHLLESARSELGMEFAFLMEVGPEAQTIRHISGDGGPFGISAGAALPPDADTLSARMLSGRVPSLLSDVRRDPRTRDPVPGAERGVGSYLGVPVYLPDGRLFGALAMVSGRADPSLGERDIRFMRVLAAMAGGQLQDEEEAGETQRARRERVERAFDDDGLSMVFQPIVDLSSEVVVGYEALARFAIEPRRPPDVWFTEAALEGLGVELELAAVRLALQGFAQLPSHAYMSVNVSPETFCSPLLLEAIAGAPTERLALELTEHARVDDYDLLRRAAERLRRRGVRLMIDDAGAGFASFKHILDLAPDAIKLDISLTRDIDRDPVRRALAASLVGFAVEIRADIIAEGVETAGELRVLRALGIACGQGYFLGRPRALRAFGAPGGTGPVEQEEPEQGHDDVQAPSAQPERSGATVALAPDAGLAGATSASRP